ncbi:T9SS type A sorting domain-containing protein [Cellulophaga sp. 20_2_10]|uniref:T9SS type A sorting domain-containing protein n=1 Tax=Cellulophaga sp. 20_2_10 TaxID=2942476 RepID=UPI00201A7BCB|nr:T9SS type A sorting domain-containing protein [Cellulophaga sp. 20_2_10]MCL5244247.1 T9SS type A sorting domain-containing protein [Cellulophaga sp. 20_2_10]
MKDKILTLWSVTVFSIFLQLLMTFTANAQLKVGDPGVIFDANKYDNRYPQMKQWEKAGVRGGIPFLKDVKVVKTLTNGANSDAINKAINDAAKQSGLVAVLLKNGAYTIDKRITMKSNVSLIGESRDKVKCVISMSSGDAFSFYKVRKSGIYTLTIEGSWGTPKYNWNYSLDANDELKNNDNISVKFNDSEDCWLDKVNILNSARDPVRVPANHITLRDLRVDGAHKKAGGAQGYFFIQGAYNLITGCEITHLRHISLQGSNVEYNVVYDNDFKQEVSFHSGDKGNNLIENNRITLPFDMPNSKADTPNSVYNNSDEPNYFAIMGPWSIQHQNSKNPNFIYKNNCLEKNHNNATPWSNPNLLYKGPRQVKPSNPATNFPALSASLTPKGETLYPIILGGGTTGGSACNEEEIVLLSEDAYLQGSQKYNTSELRVEKGKRVSYLKFKIPSNIASIVSATLHLSVSTDSGDGGIDIIKGRSSNWTEDNLSSTNKPLEASKIGTLTGSYLLGKTYQWSLSNLQAGETVTLLVKQISGNDVSFWSKGGVKPPKLVLKLNCTQENTNSIFSLKADNSTTEVKVYPNPAQNYITISGIASGKQIVVFDFTGNVVLKKVARSTAETLDISGLRPGTYIIKAEGEKSIHFFKK